MKREGHSLPPTLHVHLSSVFFLRSVKYHKYSATYFSLQHFSTSGSLTGCIIYEWNSSKVDFIDEIWIIIQSGGFLLNDFHPLEWILKSTLWSGRSSQEAADVRGHISGRVCAVLSFWDPTQNAWQWSLHQSLDPLAHRPLSLFPYTRG